MIDFPSPNTSTSIMLLALSPFSGVNNCLMAAADLCSTGKQYAEAVELYEQIARNCKTKTLLNYHVKDYLFKAMLCSLAMAANKPGGEVWVWCPGCGPRSLTWECTRSRNACMWGIGQPEVLMRCAHPRNRVYVGEIGMG